MNADPTMDLDFRIFGLTEIEISCLSLDSHVRDLRLRFAIAICDSCALMYAIFMSDFLNYFKEIQLSFNISFILFIYLFLF